MFIVSSLSSWPGPGEDDDSLLISLEARLVTGQLQGGLRCRVPAPGKCGNKQLPLGPFKDALSLTVSHIFILVLHIDIIVINSARDF